MYQKVRFMRSKVLVNQNISRIYLTLLQNSNLEQEKHIAYTNHSSSLEKTLTSLQLS